MICHFIKLTSSRVFQIFISSLLLSSIWPRRNENIGIKFILSRCDEKRLDLTGDI